jgi:hypothetical protein
MLRLFLPILFLSISLIAIAQPSDYIVLKKKNTRTLKTYFPGAFISAATYTGFNLSGIIKQIRNDSVFIEQQEVRQVPTPFGVPALDTIIHMVSLHYTEIRAYYYASDRPSNSGQKRSYGAALLQNAMILGGTAFIVLELVNTAYRNESLSDGNKLTVIAIAAGVAITGIVWKHLQKRSNNSDPKKYKVIYVNMSAKKGF